MKIEAARDLLPVAVQRIADVVGLSSALKLVEALGGTSWYFAQGVGRQGQARVAALEEIVGEDAAKRLTFLLNEREAIYIPKCDRAVRQLRDAEIHRQFDQAVREGVSTNTVVNELARTYEMSDRHVWRILKTPPLDIYDEHPVTPDLFN
ncbi:Mor transcription activator family protein [Pseudomonas solani]|uniref:Mor transcription activator family protein n=1 Tax=Pseudomonas solani TaxID=2731552 RepID=UPI0035BEA256